ncbi:MAG: PAS domain S-box protein, partial [Oscillospiraceae bacterium]|nr:PAS domain S-box protein [Oscillospiraceae bacterium]
MTDQEKQAFRIETIMNNLPGMVYQHLYNFPACTLTYVSKGSKEYIGYAPEELVGEENLVGGVNKFIAMIHPDDLEDTGNQFETAIEAGEVHEQAYRLIMQDGSIKWIRDRCTILERAPDGTPLEVQGYMFDITEQKKIEEVVYAMQIKEAIAEEEKMKLAITEASPLAYVLRDKNMNPIDCNSEVLRLFACPDKQVFLDNYWTKLMPKTQPDGQKSKEKMRAHKAEKDGRVAFEWTYLSYTGEEFPAQITLTNITYRNQPYLLSFIYDLSDIKRLEKQLESALFEAQAGSRAKSDFMSRMSHEMLTPMNIIMGMTQLLKMEIAAANQKEHLQDILNASNDLLRLIDDVLDYSNTEYNILKLDETTFSFGSMFEDVLKQFRRFIREKNQTLDCDIDKSIPALLIGDESRLSKVIASLISNAVKFTPEHGKIKFTVCVIDFDEKIITLQSEITDTGIGICKEDLQNIFDVFEQGDAADTRILWGGGGGGGLPLAKPKIGEGGGGKPLFSPKGGGQKSVFPCHQ